jgi:RNA polymerase sigma-70 factor, ECF subfamily
MARNDTGDRARRGRSPVRIVSDDADRDFERLYLDEWRSVLGLAVVLTGDRQAGEDLAQEAFTAAYRDWFRISQYDRPGAFVRRVVANKAVSRRRRLGTEQRLIAALRGRRHETGLPPDLDETWAIIRRLPARQAQVVALKYLEDLTLDEVAELLRISPDTAKTHLSRARSTLARQLPGPADDPSLASSGEEPA